MPVICGGRGAYCPTNGLLAFQQLYIVALEYSSITALYSIAHTKWAQSIVTCNSAHANCHWASTETSHLLSKVDIWPRWKIKNSPVESAQKDRLVFGFRIIWVGISRAIGLDCLLWCVLGICIIQYHKRLSLPRVSCNKCRNKFVIIHTRDRARKHQYKDQHRTKLYLLWF